MTNYTKFSKLAISAALALTTASSISFAGKTSAKAKETAKDGAAVSGKITLKAPSKESRKTASSDELKMSDKELRAALMKMRYCIVQGEEENYFYRMTFHHNNVVTLKFSDSSSSYGGDSYGGDSYGGDSYGGDSYGGEPYGGEGAGKNAAGKSSWKIKGGKVIVNLNGGPDQTLYLTKSSLAKHRCN